MHSRQINQPTLGYTYSRSGFSCCFGAGSSLPAVDSHSLFSLEKFRPRKGRVDKDEGIEGMERSNELKAEIQVTQSTPTMQCISYLIHCLSALQHRDTVTLTASGRSISKLVTIIEVAKKEYKAREESDPGRRTTQKVMLSRVGEKSKIEITLRCEEIE